MKKNKKSKKNKKRMSKLSVVLIICLVMFLSVFGYVYYFLGSLGAPTRVGEGSINTKQVGENESVNVLVMGVDIGDPELKGSPKRTDTILLMNYNPKSKDINLISIPRDTLIKIKGKNQKINAAHAIGGVNYLITAVEKLLDININYYGKVDYEGFRKIIDAIGGIDMTIAHKMDYDDPSQHLSIHFKKGETVHLDGKKAEEYFRWRKNNDGTGLANGDIDRIENQHKFIAAVIDKFKSPAIVTKIPTILSTIPKYCETNMKPEDIIKYGYIFAKTDSSKIKMVTLNGDSEYIDDVSYFLYSEKQNKEILKILHSSVETVNKESNTKLDKSKLKVQVLNGTNIKGLATETAENIKKKGYNISSVSNAEKVSKSKIIVFGISKEEAEILKDELGINNIEYNKQKNENYDIIILLGDDFKK